MNDHFLSEDDASVPALRPAARVLVLVESSEEKSGLHLNGRARAASAMKRIGEVAQNAGYLVVFAPEPILLDGELPEVVLTDGSSPHAVRTIETLFDHEATRAAVLLAVVPARSRNELLESLRVAGANDFLNSDAHDFEILTRIETATALHRSRADLSVLREQMNRQIRVDDLTGVMSRRFFFQQAHRECSRARRYGHRLSCVMIEINHFDKLVATFGEAAGEIVLRSAANIIGQWTRDTDLVARFTESKFVVLLPETGIDGATRAQDKITAALSTHQWKFDKQILPLTVSIGESELQPGAQFRRVADDYISEGDESGEAALSNREALAGLLEDADAALFVARKGARVPEVFVPYTPIPDRPKPKSKPKKPKSPRENDGSLF